MIGGAIFLAALMIGPMWASPVDVAPALSSAPSGLMNSGSAILSPLVLGMVIDTTGNWTLTVSGMIGVVLIGPIAAFGMRPDLPLAGAGQRVLRPVQAAP